MTTGFDPERTNTQQRRRNILHPSERSGVVYDSRHRRVHLKDES